MPLPSLWRLTTYAWTAFALYWLLSAARGLKPAKKKESFRSRAPHLLATIVAFTLLLDTSLRLGPWGEHFLAPDSEIRVAGVALTWLGVTIAIWARRHLGQYWSGRITWKEDHQLISSGPYRWVRHPIYSGLLLAVLGTALVLGQWRGLLAFAVLLPAHVIKARREEALMARQLGDTYEQYRAKTGFLVPRMR